MSSASIARVLLLVTLALLLVRSLRQQPLSLAELRLRLPRCVLGLAMFGVGIALFVDSGLGTPPWDVLHQGLAERFDTEIGLVINVVGLAVLPLWIPLKQRIGLGTILNTLEIGVVVDLVRPVLPVQDNFVAQLGFVIAGVVLIGIGSGIYIGSGLGPGPRDGIMTGLKALGLSVRVARTLIEVTTLTVGVLLGGVAGLGTMIFLLSIGPLVQLVLPHTTLPAIAPAAGTTPFATA